MLLVLGLDQLTHLGTQSDGSPSELQPFLEKV